MMIILFAASMFLKIPRIFSFFLKKNFGLSQKQYCFFFFFFFFLNGLVVQLVSVSRKVIGFCNCTSIKGINSRNEYIKMESS